MAAFRRKNPMLREAVNAADAKLRANLVKRGRAQRAEILQIFTDLEYWNRYVRKPDEAPIDPDPDGELRRQLKHLDALLALEDGEAEGVH